MSPLVSVLIVLVVVIAVFWIADAMGAPAPFPMIIKLVVGVLGILYILGQAGFLHGLG